MIFKWGIKIASFLDDSAFLIRVLTSDYKQELGAWVVRDVTKNQTKKLSILLSFYFHEVLQYLNTFT